jgi:hypothetical protein
MVATPAGANVKSKGNGAKSLPEMAIKNSLNSLC